jgi:chromate transporter
VNSKPDFKQLWKMFVIFFRIGAFTIGGGYAMLPLIEREIVDEQNWVSREDIVDVFAISQSLPGVIAINSSMFVGYKIAGIPGICAAALGVILPSFLIILVIAYAMVTWRENLYVSKAFTGVRAGVTALIGLSAVKLGKSVIKNKVGLWIAILSFCGIAFLEIHAMWAIIGGAIVGVLGLAGRRKQS